MVGGHSEPIAEESAGKLGKAERKGAARSGKERKGGEIFVLERGGNVLAGVYVRPSEAAER